MLSLVKVLQQHGMKSDLKIILEELEQLFGIKQMELEKELLQEELVVVYGKITT